MYCLTCSYPPPRLRVPVPKEVNASAARRTRLVPAFDPRCLVREEADGSSRPKVRSGAEPSSAPYIPDMPGRRSAE